MSARPDRFLPKVPGFDLKTQRLVHSFASQLEDLWRRMKEDIAGFPVAALEWQERPGCNTVGMLLVHCAMAETYWLATATKDIRDDAIYEHTFGMYGYRDDGLPIPADGLHCGTFAGWSLDQYLALFEKGRTISLDILRTWTDDMLDTSYDNYGRKVEYHWTLYHILEHVAMHHGQILLLRHLMADKGVVPRPKDE